METIFTTPEGEVALIDVMPFGQPGSHIIRRVEGRRGEVTMGLHRKLRFGFGSASPWLTSETDECSIVAIAGADLVTLRGPVSLQVRDFVVAASFAVRAGQSMTFIMSHGASHLPPPAPFDADAALAATEQIWRTWSAKCSYDGPRKDAVLRSLIVLKALIYEATGGIVAAPTTSLPERRR